jgi:Activator of Hsp90 ATPase homolog 1-like protein
VIPFLEVRHEATEPWARTSEVEIRFIAESSQHTQVELEHGNLARHGEGWEGRRAAVDREGGWPLYLKRLGALHEA